MLTEAYLEPSRTSMMELFSLQLNHILKSKLNSIKLPLGCIVFCYTTQSFVKKTYNCENFWRKSLLLTIEQFFFSKFKIMQWNTVINKGF